MSTVRRVLHLMLANWRALVRFELAFRVITSLTLAPVLFGTLNLLMALMGYSYLTWENVFAFVALPPVAVACALAALLLVALTIFEVAAVLLILDQSREGMRVTVGQAARYGLRQARRAFRPRNVLLPIYALLLVPLLNVGVSTGVVRSVVLPEFVMAALDSDRMLGLAYLAVMAVGALALMRWIYVFNAFVLEGLSFRQSRRRSARLTRGHMVGNLAAILFSQLGLLVVAGLAIVLSVGASLLVTTLLPRLSFFSTPEGSVLAAVIAGAVAVPAAAVALLSLALAPSATYACVCVHYWQRLEELGEATPDPEPWGRGSRHMHYRRRPTAARVAHGAVAWLAASCAIAWLVSGSGVETLLSLGAGANDAAARTSMQVTAHRGAALEAPENTMAAFRLAAEQGADWIELDVQQSADGKLFVCHDTNLGRVSGVNKNSWEMSWDEISQLDVGSHFSSAYAGERVPLLSEVCAWAAENGVSLNIELKPTGHEHNFEVGVAQVIRDSGMADRCMVTSLNYDCLKRMRAAAPEIRRAYVMTLAYGRICDLDAADAFSVEEMSATPLLVRYLHENGREVLAWTINDPANVEAAMRNGVDNVITDDVPSTRKTLQTAPHYSLVEKGLLWLLGTLT